MPVVTIITNERLKYQLGWVTKKEALGIGDYDLGEILGVEVGHVITKKGTVDKDKFSLPKDL